MVGLTVGKNLHLYISRISTGRDIAGGNGKFQDSLLFKAVVVLGIKVRGSCCKFTTPSHSGRVSAWCSTLFVKVIECMTHRVSSNLCAYFCF